MQPIITFAPAKINLGLEVLGKRADGFHEINTVFLRTNLCDELEFSPAKALMLECEPDLGIRPTENLVYRTAELLHDYAGKNKLFKNSLQSKETGAKIRVRKHIPSGAGLGGGSSDAAAALLALKDLWHLPISQYELHMLASMLGSDVPFFLQHGAAVGIGRGEKLEYFDYKLPWWTVIVYPNIHVNTAEAYRALNRTHNRKAPTDFKNIILESFDHPELLQEKIVNDFEESVFKSHPEIASVKQSLYDSGAIFALMSGSGSGVFGFFLTQQDALQAMSVLKNYFVFLSEPQ